MNRLFDKIAWRGKREPSRDPIGLPRALFYFLHPRLWEAFFKSLGVPVVVSSPTSRPTLERAGLISETEHCLPVKILDAHLDALIGKVRRVFVPRILSQRRGYIACPKLAALPDAVRAQFGDRFEIVTIDVDERRQALDRTLEELGSQLEFGRAEAETAAREARRALAAAEAPPAKSQAGAPGKRFLLIGHPYNLEDGHMSEPIVRKMASLGATVERMTFDGPLPGEGPLRWDTSAHMLERLRQVDSKRFAGVLQLTSFNCGCDSMASVYYRETLKAAGVPYMALTLDAHSAQAGLETRLEAFTDSIGGGS
jgi:predicted nucleotide-binding protein (sugar kinase/HSP70/actin superfamily)